MGDDGPDRFAMFLGERKPDERYIVRFPQNVDGDYEAYGHPVWMYGPYPVRGVYTQPMRAIPATEACYVIGGPAAGGRRPGRIRLHPRPAVPDHLAVYRRGHGLAPGGPVF